MLLSRRFAPNPKRKYPKLKFLIILGYGTDWAANPAYANVKGAAIGSPQRGIDVRPVDDPRNLYGQYVYEAVRRYHDVVDAWESWNEPDLPGHHYFKGSGADFMPYQRAFYLAATKADPNCTALFAAMTFASPEGNLHAHHLNAPSPNPVKASFFEQYLQALAKDPNARAHNDYFDVMNQHSYSRATDMYDYTAVDRKLMIDYLGEEGETKPIWITEMGITDKAGTWGCTPDEYCDYVLQSYAWGKLAGVQRFFHFQLDNSNGHGLYSGMLGHPKPALTTYRDMLVKEFARVTQIAQIHGHPGVGFLQGNSAFKPTWQSGYDAFEFQTTHGRRLLMAFADTDKTITVKLPAKASSATLIDRHNQRKTIEAKDGSYEVTLHGATNVGGWPATDDPLGKALGQPEHLIGGSTLVLVEKPSN